MEGIGTLGRLGLGVYCCSCIPTTFSSGLLTAWRAAKRFYAEGFSFLFDNTSLCCPVSTSLFPYLCLLFSAVDVILIGLDCSFSAHIVFVIKLELVIFYLGV